MLDFNWQDYQSQLSIFINVVIATILVAIIGLERETRHKPAGLRTNMIIGGATCLFVSLTGPLIDFLEKTQNPELLRIDPIRVLEAIVVGISFIGAGTILKSKEEHKVLNLTTAATLLISGCIGIAVALQQYYLAIGITALLFTINRILNRRTYHK
ncbi:MAG TPA: magnesium transporter [Cytophagales bacterium]|jgi:putative Mg2+ transporter-C (MgtC) family protein|nr:magnesium transporter [Cytophagales bacterium]